MIKLFKLLTLCVYIAFPLTVDAQVPKNGLYDILYDIDENRRAKGRATPIGENLWLSADHVIRDDVSSLGKVIATNRKKDWCLIEGPTPVQFELRRTPLRPGETLYFEGGTLRVQNDLSFQVTSGRAVSGMSGGAIFDSQGRVVSVVCEGNEGGTTQLWGYLGVADWVDCEMENRKTQVSFTPVVYGDE